jgi:uncharacterized protein (TIGR03437 family)
MGNWAIDRSLAGLATGPVQRVWYPDSGSISIQTASGRVFETANLETWRASNAAVPAQGNGNATTLPESGAQVRSGPASDSVIYAFGKFVYRSENGGASWDNLTGFRGQSIVGTVADLAVSPKDSDQIVAAGSDGVFRSADGGKSWCGLNQGLPNLPATRLVSVPAGDTGAHLELKDGTVVEWQPGQKIAWTPVDDLQAASDAKLRQLLSQRVGVRVTAVASSGSTTYAGRADGAVMVSDDQGSSWSAFPFSAGSVDAFWVDPNDSSIALAVFGLQRDASSTPQHVHVARTENGGKFWDDITSNLPDIGVHGIVADRASGAIYAATDQGVFMTYADLSVLGPPPNWEMVGLLPSGAVDVKLDAQANQLFTATDGYGVYSMLAPHRLRDPRVVSTADWVARATAPGALISVLGSRVETARDGDLQIPVLTATETESQLQVPFDAGGSTLSLSVDGGSGPMTLKAVALEPASPAIFVDRDGTPVLLDGESEVMLDAMHPAHSNGRIQILATGLGKVKPDWPTGVAGPVENPPAVAAPVNAYLDRQPVEVTRAVLAPYIGFYLVEINVPKIVNSGPEELYVEVGGQASNRVRVYIEP